MSDPIGGGRTFSGDFGGSIEDGDCVGGFNGDFGGNMEDDGGGEGCEVSVEDCGGGGGGGGGDGGGGDCEDGGGGNDDGCCGGD